MRYFIVLAIVVCFTACNQKRSLEHPPQAIFYKGNPLELIRGATLNPISPLLESDIPIWNGIELTYERIFRAIGPDKDGFEIRKSITDAIYKFIPTGVFGEYWFSSGEVGSIEVLFELQADGRIGITGIKDGDGKFFPIKILHYSALPEFKTLSILFYLEFSHRQSELVQLIFSPAGDVSTAKTGTSFQYLYGSGVKLAWEKPLTLNICHPNPIHFSTNDLTAWNEIMPEPGIRLKHLSSYPPFSDLEVQCVYLIKNFYRTSGITNTNTGTTYPIVNPLKKNIIDGDIILWESELKKNGNGHDVSFNTFLLQTLLHEIGHLLGLGHEDNFPSIMSSHLDSELKTELPSEYDQAAIFELYSR